ncbi:MAG: hypothetical protein RR178_05250 [Gordonibacter sp.]
MSTLTLAMGLVKPDTNDKTEDTIAALADNFERLDKAASFVGMVIQSTRLIVPADIYGGTWTPLQGRMLIGAGTDFPAGATGGEARVKLTISEMPSHRHPLYFVSGVGVSGYIPLGDSATGGYSDSAMDPVGGDAAHNNMPPYKAVYMWERTA